MSKISRDFENDYYSQNLCNLYRQVQVLMILCNKSFQTYLWPSFEFYGAIGLITLMYSLIMFQRHLGNFGVVIFGMFTVGIAAICCSVLAMGSKAILLSTKVIHNVKLRKDCCWSRKFFLSCPTISIRVGKFHKIDSARVPAFIRFVLQRTFFLVLKTKLSLGSKFDLELPF